MNWDAIGTIAELVGAVAVVISLVYIAAQVRSGAASFETSLRDSSYRSLMEFNYSILGDEELCWIFQKGMRNLDDLSEVQQARAISIMYAFFKVWENTYLHYLEGSVEEDVWESNSKVLSNYAALPGAQNYLKDRLPIFAPRFQQLLRELQPAQIRSDRIVDSLHNAES